MWAIVSAARKERAIGTTEGSSETHWRELGMSDHRAVSVTHESALEPTARFSRKRT